MSRKAQVRFCERLRVRFPWATHPTLVFELDADAKRVMAVLSKRFEKYGLTLHPEKTRVVPFKRPPWAPGTVRGRGEHSFDLLGFTHYWAKSLQGSWVIQRKTAKDRFKRAIQSITEWWRENRHMPVESQQKILGQKLRGHYGYYGITGNSKSIGRFLDEVQVIWRKCLHRRSQQRRMSWERFNKLLTRYPLPPAVCVHSIYRRT